MKLFEKFSNDQKRKLYKDTSNFFIGSPEAEAESIYTSKIKLTEVFEDFLQVIPKLATEKFILSGRKGNGKSAIAEHIHFLASNEPEYFCEFIRKADIDIEKITQLTKSVDTGISQELIIEWVILVNFVKQLISNEKISSRPQIRNLEIFLKKNSGFVDIKSNQIEEVIQSKGWELNVNYFKRYVDAKFGNSFDIKSGKAPFYKLLPHLKEVVKDLFLDPLNRDNHYILIFDDLDIGFNSQDDGNIKTMLNILRVVKDYNITFFGKNGINAKIILLLRDDIAKILLNKDADTAKIFSSYEIPLRWYEHEKSYTGEDKLKIKQFINKRIAHNFELNQFEYDAKNPWESLLSDKEDARTKSTFKYVIDHTLIRPRDLILFFKPLQDLKYKIPLGWTEINNLLGLYSVEFVKEMRNELAAHYSSTDIDIILKVFKNCVNQSITHGRFCDELDKFEFKHDKDVLLDLLFDLSLIGNINDSGTYFKHWEQDDQVFKYDKESKIIIHFSLRNYCQRQRN